MGESQRKVIVLAIVFMVLPTIAVGFRLWAKVIKKLRPTADDYMILPALVIFRLRQNILF